MTQDGLSNRQRIFLSLSSQDRKKNNINSANDVNSDTEIKTPIEFVVQSDFCTLDSFLSKTSFEANKNDYNAFVDTNIRNILNKQEFKSKTTQKSSPSVSVWIWSRSIGQ